MEAPAAKSVVSVARILEKVFMRDLDALFLCDYK
jgi:hypothetical protein